VPLVTALRATRRGGVALHVDGEYVCVVSESLVARWRLFKGRELAREDLAELKASASVERVAGDAHRLLGHRARSRYELHLRLLAKGHDEAVVAHPLERHGAAGVPDDADFARSYVADKRRLESWGAERIRRGLRQLGVDAAIVDAAIGAEEDDDSRELARALAVLRKRGAPRPPLEADRRRAFDTLRRKGFSTSTAYAAVRDWAERR
jgi:regulatory protein